MVPNPNVPHATVPNVKGPNSKALTRQIVDVIKSQLTGLSFLDDKHALRGSLGLG
jgi:hypothetical protein